MAREKYQTLTEQMFYTLLSLNYECCGVDIMKKVADLTDNRVQIGAGTLYALLDNFIKERFIQETKIQNRKKNYILTPLGKELLEKEYTRLLILKNDYEFFISKEDFNEK